MRLQQSRIVLQGQTELADCCRSLLLFLPNQPKVEMRLGRMRLQSQSLFEVRCCTLQIPFFGEPDTYSVQYLCTRRTGRRVRSRCRRFAGIRHLRRGSCADEQQQCATENDRLLHEIRSGCKENVPNSLLSAIVGLG